MLIDEQLNRNEMCAWKKNEKLVEKWQKKERKHSMQLINVKINNYCTSTKSKIRTGVENYYIASISVYDNSDLRDLTMITLIKQQPYSNFMNISISYSNRNPITTSELTGMAGFMVDCLSTPFAVSIQTNTNDLSLSLIVFYVSLDCLFYIYLFINFVDEQVIITTMENWMIERGSNNRT